MQTHDDRIRDQFTKQAVPFTRLKGHLDSVAKLIELTAVTSTDTVLDVACGPGLVACEFAKTAKHVSGIDLTDKMIGEARKRQAEMDLSNLDWQVGSATQLPFSDGEFSVVISRYTFHHFTDPDSVLAEMIRVCRPGGRVLVADPVLPEECVDAFNRMERLRDPSHTQALSVEQFDRMFLESGLIEIQRAGYDVEMELERQIAASFPEPGDDERLRQIFRDDIASQGLGIGTRQIGDEIHFRYPISIYVGTKEGERGGDSDAE